MKKRILSSLLTLCLMFGTCVTVMAESTVYTFTGVYSAKPGDTVDVTNARLTDEITVTTSGLMNYKSAGITDLEHHGEIGCYPISGNFKADGYYMFLGTASTNDNTVFTLNLPTIEKGSTVTITYAKPIVTNNGSAWRNTNDPYAYFEIGDRYLSINGDEMDTWYTKSVTIGEDTNELVFTCNKWGSVAVSKIEITKSNAGLHTLNIKSTQYANLTVNGVKFYADENGELTLSSFADGETITVKAEKDGYTSKEETVTVNGTDVNIDIPLESETGAVYYESDFGNSTGNLTLDGEFGIGNIETKDVTKLAMRFTFTENGELSVLSDSSSVAALRYDNGIYLGDELITKKDNAELELIFDKNNKKTVVSENGKSFSIDGIQPDTITAISGKNASIEYISVSYPDTSKITIDGSDKVSSLPHTYSVSYSIEPEYQLPGTTVTTSVIGNDNVSIDENVLFINPGATGKAVICAEYNGAKATKEIEIVPNPEIVQHSNNGTILNLGSTQQFILEEAYDKFGDNLITNTNIVKDYKSSDESVIKIDSNGLMTAVGKGTADISVNAYTGIDNIISYKYIVGCFYINGITSNDITYIPNEFSEDENISGYKISYSDGTSEEIELSSIPAYEAKTDATAVITYYDKENTLISTRSKAVNAGDKLEISSSNKRVYLYSENTFTEITEADSEMPGFKTEHTPGEEFEISPVYTFTSVGDVKDAGKTFDTVFADGLYNITFKKADTWRGDIFVNGYMVGNNVDQADADRKVTDGSLYVAEDIKITDGTLNVSMTDGSTMLDYVKVEKQPNFRERPARIYIIGDSLACAYYGEFSQEVGGGRAGWGQQLPDFLNVPVTNLANSGQYAAGLYRTAFPSVIENGCEGDILLIECGYNDRNYSNRDEMIACVKDMISQCRKAGIIPILVTPNASKHDYKPSVVWSNYLRDIAYDTNTQIIDLSQESYDFLYSLYGDDTEAVTMNYNLTAVGGDTLHSSYAGAYKWAEIVAQGLKNLGYEDMVNTDFSYTFIDTLGNKITAQVK